MSKSKAALWLWSFGVAGMWFGNVLKPESPLWARIFTAVFTIVWSLNIWLDIHHPKVWPWRH